MPDTSQPSQNLRFPCCSTKTNSPFRSGGNDFARPAHTTAAAHPCFLLSGLAACFRRRKHEIQSNPLLPHSDAGRRVGLKRQRPRFPEALADTPFAGVVLRVSKSRANHCLFSIPAQVTVKAHVSRGGCLSPPARKAAKNTGQRSPLAPRTGDEGKNLCSHTGSLSTGPEKAETARIAVTGKRGFLCQ